MIPLSKPFLGAEEKQAVLEVLDSGMLAQGSKTAQLEGKFSALCGTQEAIATSSGTTALHVALLAHGIGPGDEVITTPFTFMASVNCILYAGARPVFVDVEADTFNIDPALIEAAITPRTKAILPVHLYGHPYDMDALMDIAHRHHLVIIEDACQAVGACWRGQPVGSFGTGCFSLYATKNVMAGEGGMITTNDPAVAQRCRMIRNHGMQRRYYHDLLGYNFRISDLHAAIGAAQMDRLAGFTKQRQENAAFLNAHIRGVIIPTARPECQHVWHQYTIRLNGGRDREAAVKALNDAGIGTGIFYPVPAYRQAHLAGMGYGDLCLPVAESLAREVISLPVHPLLTQADLDTIVEGVNRL
jgi:dTDP-4-amino-4,6-dideoxygalactose transaminase